MESDIPKYDLPVDYVIGEGRAKDLLDGYQNFPCMIESGFFILCVKGSMQVTINATTYDIGENDLMHIRGAHILIRYPDLLCRLFISFYRKYKFDESYPASSSANNGKSGCQTI